jgi:hypothetical protein
MRTAFRLRSWSVVFGVALFGAGCFPTLPPEEPDTGGGGDTVVGADTQGGTDTVNPAGTPTGVTATRDDPDNVEITWNRVVGANLYRVFRCDTDCDDDASWQRISDETLTDTVFVDTTADAAPTPGAPVLSLDSATPTFVALTMSRPETVPGTLHRYRVTAVSDGFESAPSDEVEGQRADPEPDGFRVAPQ